MLRGRTPRKFCRLILQDVVLWNGTWNSFSLVVIIIMIIIVIISIFIASFINSLAETTPLDPALKVMVMAMKDEAIVLTAAVIRLSTPSTNATNWHAWKPHTQITMNFAMKKITFANVAS